MTGKAALIRQMVFCFYRCHYVAVYSLTNIQEAFICCSAPAQDNKDNQNKETHSFVSDMSKLQVSEGGAGRGAGGNRLIG